MRSTQRIIAIVAIIGILTSPLGPLVSPLAPMVANASSPPTDAAHWWKGDGSYSDSGTPGGVTGTPSGGMAFDTGEFGQALSFNGTDAQTQFGNVVGNFGTADFSVTFWIRTTSASGMNILGKRPVCGHGSFWNFRGAAPTISVELDQDGSGTNYNAFGNSRRVNDGKYHAVALVRQGSTAWLYVDGFGTSHSTTGTTNLSSTAPLQAGTGPCSNRDGSKPFSGQLDEIQVFNRALSPSEVLALAQPTNQLLYDWSFNTNATDSVAGANATLANGAPVGDCQLVLYQSSQQYASLPIGAAIGSLNSASFEAWVTQRSFQPAWSRIFDFGTSTNVNMFLTPRAGDTNTPRFAITTGGNGAEQRLTASSPFPVGGPTHVVVTIDGAAQTAFLYINGVAVATETDMTLRPASLGVTGNNWLGRSQYTGDPYLAGSIDQFRVYNYALSASQVSTDFAAGPTAGCTPTPPVVTSTVTGQQGANGWYTSDVNASWAASDPESLLFTQNGCTSTTLSADTTGTTLTCAATNGVDLSTTQSVTIKRDATPPTLSGSPTTNPISNGWYRGDVSIHWTCSDAISGVQTCPTNSTITGEGASLTASATATDNAGNSRTVASSPAVSIDRTAPVTTANAPSGWNNSSVTVQLSATDNLSGVQATSFVLDGGAQQTGTSVTISSEGTHTLEYWSVDNAGNVETHHTAQIKIDLTPPTINHSLSPTANPAGWNNANVTVTFVCADALSGVASCSAPQMVTTEGASQAVTGTAVDNAGNTATDPATVSVDKTPPTITASRAPAIGNVNGWNNQAVVVSFTCGDSLSGVASCPIPVTVNEGASQSVAQSAVDAAGNSAAASITGINVDLTPPVLTVPTSDVAAEATGPNGAPVSFTVSANDALSGLDGTVTCTSASGSTFAIQTTPVACMAKDKAGNTSSASFNVVVKDTTPPTIDSHSSVAAEATSASGAAVVYTPPATHDLVDGTGIATCSPAPGSIFPLGTATVTCTAADAHGNAAASTSFSVTVRDTTPPDATIIGSSVLNEGDTGNWTVTASDLVTPEASLLITWDFGDGSPGAPTGPAVSHKFVDNKASNQPYSVTATVKDQAGNAATVTELVTVSNVAPTVTGITAPLDPIQLGTAISASATFTDPGTADTHTAVFDWGDNTTSAATVTETSGSGTATASHTYTTPGVYAVGITVTDKDGGAGSESFKYVVIYDPNGGFVTGGGWINSPSGACQLTSACTGATGKASFGFNSKYQRGATVPSGDTQFQFQAGNLSFHSTSYQWLVIAGAKAQYKGSGTINGSGNYGFILTAIDGQVSGGGGTDKFRIKIWDNGTGGVVYDNQMGADDTADPTTGLGGGSIVIHS